MSADRDDRDTRPLWERELDREQSWLKAERKVRAMFPDLWHPANIKALAMPPPRKPRAPRKPTLAGALREADKAGRPVRGAVIEADKIELKFGEPEGPEATNPWLDDLKVTKQ
jgi:hypothetical protein